MFKRKKIAGKHIFLLLGIMNFHTWSLLESLTWVRKFITAVLHARASVAPYVRK